MGDKGTFYCLRCKTLTPHTLCTVGIINDKQILFYACDNNCGADKIPQEFPKGTFHITIYIKI